MGISLDMIEKMGRLGLFPKSTRISVLDIGSSNLYSATKDGILQFLSARGIAYQPENEPFAERLAKGSAYDSIAGGVNGAFVGELLEKAGINYNAIDIADGYRTTILDLNHESAPQPFVGAFDLVLNFGTTEHLLNQFNAFKVMHDATKVGGCIVNSLPCIGYSNHGYFTYTPRCMFDLAGYNEYELVAFWYEGPDGNNDLFAPIRDYQAYFPTLSRSLAERETTETGQKVSRLHIPDVGLVAIYRKVKARPFVGSLERSTSVGTVPTTVTSGYEAEKQRGVSEHSEFMEKLDIGPAITLDRHDEIALGGHVGVLRERFIANELDLEECLSFYTLVVDAHGHFPFDWEYRILQLGLERNPERLDLCERLAVVKSKLDELQRAQ